MVLRDAIPGWGFARVRVGVPHKKDDRDRLQSPVKYNREGNGTRAGAPNK